MAWTKFIVQTKTATGTGTGVKTTLRKTKASPASLGLTLTAPAAADFDWANGDKLEVLIGDGPQHGLIRLRKNNSVGTAVVSERKALHGKHYFRLTLGHIPQFVDRSEPAKWTRFEKVEQGWVEFIMPSWAEETVPAKTVPAPAVRPAVSPSIAAAATFQRPRRDTTASIMGDPPADRSALAEKQRA